MNNYILGMFDNGVGVVCPLQQEDYQKELNGTVGGVTPPYDPFWWLELLKP